MLTRLFNSNNNFSLAALIFTGLAIWVKAFFNDLPMAEPAAVSPLYNTLFAFTGSLTFINAIIAIGLLFLEALLINSILAENELIPRNSYLGAFVFIIFSGFFNDLIVLNPVLIANLFIIAAIRLFFRLYEEQEAYATVFNIGTLLSIATMFYFPSVAFLPLIWIGYIVFRIFSWREWFIVLLGLALPYLYLGSYYFISDCFFEKLAAYKEAFAFIDLYGFEPTLNAYIVISALGLFLLLSFFRALWIVNEKAIRIRKYLAFFLWFIIINFVSLAISGKFGHLGFVMQTYSLSVLFTVYISYSKKPSWSETLLITLLLLLITGRFGLWGLFGS